jgi:hypothetical protein
VRDGCSQKVSKNPKIVCAQVTLTKTGLSAVRTFSPLGVKNHDDGCKHTQRNQPKHNKRLISKFLCHICSIKSSNELIWQQE